MIATKMGRQGDVLLVSVNETSGKEVDVNGKAILALGEVTGHHHRFEGENMKMFRHDDGSGFVKLLTEKPILHEEHTAITFAKGNWEQVYQVEFSPDFPKRVAD